MKVVQSFKYAFNGLKLVMSERNMKIHLLCMVIVGALGWWLAISSTQWLVLFLSIGLVLCTEIINTAIEELGDVVVKHNREAYDWVGKSKDLGAGAVLVASLTALVVGCVIFLPSIVSLLGT